MFGKKIILLCSCLLMVFAAPAQTQQGVVKTKGRMVNGQLVPGKGIPSAAVAVRGRSTVLSQASGKFSFSIPGQTFALDSVSKKGYQLVDADALTKPYKYSSNPLYLVMETPEQQLEDKLVAERKIRRTLQRQLQLREDELEELKAQNKLTQEEYRDAIQQLYDVQQTNEKLIADMAKEYARMDYDQMDEFQRKVTDLLENGQLEQADSMLRTRGDMQSRIREINKEQETEAKEEAELSRRQKKLAASKEGTQKKLELVATDCYNFYQRFLQAHQNDSAAYYLELRAQLDTTNLLWQSDAALFIREYLADYPRAMSYYHSMLRQAIERDGEESEWTANSYNEIGIVCECQANYAGALEYYGKALDIRQKVFEEDHPDVGQSYHNLAKIYYWQGDYAKALEYFQKSLPIHEKALGSESKDVATIYGNMGMVYTNQGDYTKALEYNKKALDIRLKVCSPEDSEVATSYNNIARIYSDKGDTPKALEYLLKAMPILEKTFGTEHPDVAVLYNNIGFIYSHQGEYTKALEYLSKSMSILEKIFGLEHPATANIYNNIGGAYSSQGNYSKALEYYTKALAIREEMFGQDNPDVGTSYNNVGYAYSRQGDYTKALEYYKKALDIRQKLLGQEHRDTKNVLNELHTAQYLQALSLGTLPEFLSEHVFTVEVAGDDAPAAQQGMTGEYYLLEFADWNQESKTSIYDKMDEMTGKSKDILVLKDGKVSLHHFEDEIGIINDIKEVSKEERQRINKAYGNWKKQNRK